MSKESWEASQDENWRDLVRNELDEGLISFDKAFNLLADVFGDDGAHRILKDNEDICEMCLNTGYVTHVIPAKVEGGRQVDEVTIQTPCPCSYLEE